MKRIALFPGTFDPFTIGHQSLVTRGLTLVDEIVISIGINDKQLYYFNLTLISFFDEMNPLY